MPDRPQPLVITERMPGVVAPGETEKLSLIVFGGPGVGKTFFAGTAADDPRTRRVLFCDAEKGTSTIAWRGRTQDDPGLDIYRMGHRRDFGEDMQDMITQFRVWEQRRARDGTPLPYNCVVLDSLTEVADKTKAVMLRQPNPKRDDPDDLAWGEWSTLYNKLRSLITFFRDLDVHLIVTALEREIDGKIYPSLPGKQMAPKLPAFFSMVGRLDVVPTPGAPGQPPRQERRLLLANSAKYIAKDRSAPAGLLPRHVVNPTVTDLLDRMETGRAVMAETVFNRRAQASSDEDETTEQSDTLSVTPTTTPTTPTPSNTRETRK